MGAKGPSYFCVYTTLNSPSALPLNSSSSSAFSFLAVPSLLPHLSLFLVLSQLLRHPPPAQQQGLLHKQHNEYYMEWDIRSGFSG